MKRITYISLILLTFIILAGPNAWSQDDSRAAIRGFVYEKNTGEPVIFTNVYLANTSYGSATDVNGYFVISKIPAGDYTLMVTYLGYDTLQMPLSLKEGDVLTKKLFLTRAAYMLDGFSVSAERQEAKTETKTSVVKLTPKQIKQIPTIGGQPDLAQYLQVLPGVIFTGDQGGQLYIRGGSPVQNKVLLDGLIIYNPFHSIGLFSVFDTDIIRNADIFTGGFGAEHGGRISSVMDITTRDGNKKRYSGRISASTFGAKALIEGPISKQKEGKASSASFILSAKNSYLEQSSEVFYDYIDTTGLPFNYTDIYGKISINGSNGSKVNFFGFNFKDQVNNYQAISDFKWNSAGGGLNFLVIPGKSPALIEGNVAYSSYKITMDDEALDTRSSEINGFNMGFDFTYFLGKDEVKYGIEMQGFKTVFDFTNSLNRKIGQEENTTELGAYLKYKLTAGKLLIEPSMRIQWYASLSNISPEPRFAMKYNATSNLRFKLAGGLYSQNLISARSDQDVVNLFYGFLSGSDNLPDEFDGKEITHSLQKSQHIILGMEYDLGQNLSMNLEAYYKNYSQLTNLNRNKLYDDNEANADLPDEQKKDFIIEKGHAKGVDLSLKYDENRIYIWAVYSLSYVDRYDGSITYNPHFDRRHNVNILMTYFAGMKKDWEFSLRWNLGSGFPYTLTQGFYEKLTFEGGINEDYTSANGDLGIQLAELNGGRLPYYHRLDLSVKKTFNFSENTRLEINAGVTNVYDRDNVFYVDRISNQRVDQLPIMPSAGMSFYF